MELIGRIVIGAWVASWALSRAGTGSGRARAVRKVPGFDKLGFRAYK